MTYIWLDHKDSGYPDRVGKDLKTEVSPRCLGIGSHVMAWAGKKFFTSEIPHLNRFPEAFAWGKPI